MAACVAGTVIYYFFHSVFNALVIWRGYERLVPRIRVNFSGYIELLVERLHLYVPWAVPWGYLLFPVQFIVTAIASIHIDLSAVQVTCRGAQVAGYLFINFLVTNFIVLIIASDWQVYWTTAWQRLLGRNVFLLSNRHYLRYAGGTGVYHALSALVLGLLPEPKKWIQYALGFVSLQIFFADNGHSPSDTNCDATMPFPIDTALAYGATVAAGLMFFPTIFVIAQVLVPSFTFTRPYHPLAGQMERLYDRSVVNRCKAEGRIAWLFHQEEFCSYKDVLELVRRDVVDGFPLWCDTRDTAFAIPLLSAGLAQLLWPCHLLWSPHGRGIWWRVLKNYVYLGMVSLGIWTDASVEDFRVFARYDDFKRSLAFMSKQQTLPSSSSSESQRMRYMANPLASSTLFAAYGIPFLDDASEDPQELLQYVASNIASRVVLLQLVPYLTAVSVVMADIATCPMFLFSSKLRSRLPPYILWTPFAEARRLLRQSMQWRTVDAQRRRRSTGIVDLEAGSRSAAGGATATTHTVEKDPPVWMVWFLGQKLFVTQSLLVRFVVSLTVNFLSLALVFLPTILLDFALLVMVAVMVLMGISVGLYAILLLHRFMFPNAFDADVLQTDPSISSTAVPAAPAVDPPVVPPPVDGPEGVAPVGGRSSEITHPTAANDPSNDAASTSTTSDRSVNTAADVATAGAVVRRSAEGASSNPSSSLDRSRPASSTTEVTVITMVTMITVVTPTEAVLGDSSDSRPQTNSDRSHELSTTYIVGIQSKCQYSGRFHEFFEEDEYSFEFNGIAGGTDADGTNDDGVDDFNGFAGVINSSDFNGFNNNNSREESTLTGTAHIAVVNGAVHAVDCLGIHALIRCFGLC
eukprot:gene13170-9434_t